MHDPAIPNPENSALTPREIDARHARHLLEKALAQLEKGERAPAAVLCKQAVHLAPHSPRAHSVAGFIALLDGDFNGAISSYEKVTGTFEDGATERERLVALRMARTSKTPPNVAALIPNTSAEILRLRHAVQTAPMAEFYGSTDNGAAPREKDATAVAAAMAARAAAAQEFVPPPPSVPAVTETPSKNLQGKRPLNFAIMGAAAIFAALFCFLVVRSMTEPTEMQGTGTATTTTATAAPAATPQPADASTTPGAAPIPTPGAPAPPPPTATPAPAATPVSASAPAPRPRATQAPVNRPQPNIPQPNLQRPPTTTSRPPAATPRATPAAPADADDAPLPPGDPRRDMPRPRMTLPGTTGDEPDFPRVAP